MEFSLQAPGRVLALAIGMHGGDGDGGGGA